MGKKQLDQFPTEILKSNMGEAQTLASSKRRQRKVSGQEYKIAWINCFELRAKLEKMDTFHHITGNAFALACMMHDVIFSFRKSSA